MAQLSPEPITANPAELRISQGSGYNDAPFDLTVTSLASATVWYSTNGSVPTPEHGAAWSGLIRVERTTVLRTALYQGGQRKGAVETHTYLFPESVKQQSGAGFPQSWGLTNGEPVAAAYGLSREVVEHPRYRDLIAPALRALPSVSIVADGDDLFGQEKGIYAHPQESGLAWERPASAELLYPDGRQGFQIDCGVRIQGGWNRRPEESPKHSLRLVFSKRFGPSRLAFPLFEEPGTREFETLILRAGCNNTWLPWNGEERARGEYIRDQWMRDTLRAMGHLSPRGLFVHLYLNGLYWGIYNLVERPSAPFVAAHLGGSPKDYDSRNGDHLLEGSESGWRKLMRLVNASVETPRPYAAVEPLLDMPEFIDYMIANLYGANQDWDRSSNWYGARRRKPPGQFMFFVWDGERTLEGVDDNRLDFDDDESPARIFQKLRENPDFRHTFADRANKHLTGQGALTPEAAAQRYRVWSDRLDLAIVAESARWGSYRRDVHRYKTGPYELYTRDEFWRPEVKRLLTDYFPRRTAVVLRQFQAAGLAP